MATALMILDADHLVAVVESYAVHLMIATREEHAAVADRDELLARLVAELLPQTNPLTNKPHSATSAEAAAKLTDEYKKAQARRINAECKKIGATADYERALLRAKLAVANAGGGR